ncbi:hypothetical protein LTR08_001815 [Meristemomyces frigidus]|nr:hypothetical protein LTR08_001815 [Meristemomyces frigidus]
MPPCTHPHPWPPAGPLTICPGERFCQYCVGAAAKTDHGVAANLRRHVYETHSDEGQRDRAGVEVMMYRPWATVKGGGTNPHWIRREEVEEGFAAEEAWRVAEDRAVGDANATRDDNAGDGAGAAAHTVHTSASDQPTGKASMPRRGDQKAASPPPDRRHNSSSSATLAQNPPSQATWKSQAGQASAAKALAARRALQAHKLAGRGLLPAPTDAAAAQDLVEKRG